ncbi:YczE/YyaS/YitT family protein [Ferdinandcohnia quinoae]|uniref:DUF6198 family protein n=1 Tax=Fredinandcohnia quinoae TaxID=2918902 RepID=A0AAW5E591_9BACI|nr:DUF6198 family protein [Fredinandcohnia sp. SECRCQ15]MCH1626014.1 DUF6198 family protein [Fredinandcohnia sp. SECRCQ15]
MQNGSSLVADRSSLVKRWIVYIIGIYILSIGVSLAIRAGIGISPQSAFQRVFVVHIDWLTQGRANFILEVIMLILAFLVYRKGFKLYHIMGLLVAGVFAICLDFNLSLAFTYVELPVYWTKLVTLVIGDAFLAFGVFLMLQSNVVLMPIDNFVDAVKRRTGFKWGNVKTCFDLTLLALAIIFGLILAGKIMFVREGTILNAILVGQYIRLFTYLYNKHKEKKELPITPPIAK